MTLSWATNAGTRTVPIIPPMPASRPTALPAPAPAVAEPALLPAPAPRTSPEPPQPAAAQSQTVPPPSATAYFDLFRPCRCGHSSAWHSGAFGEAWRSGHQVHGACEASADSGAGCACRAFAETR